MMDEILAEMRALTPKTGHNVVAIDEYAMPGKRLRLIEHTALLSHAQARKAALEKESPGDYAIYSPVGETSAEDDEMAARDRIKMGLPAK